MNLRDLKINVRLGLGFGIVLLLLAIVAGIGMTRMEEVHESVEHVIEENNVQLELANEMRASVIDRMLALRNIALLTNEAEMKPEVERIDNQARKYAEAEEKLGRMFSTLDRVTDEEKAALAKLKPAEASAQPIIKKAIELGLANKTEEATKVLINELRPEQRKWVDALDELIAIEKKMNLGAAHEAEEIYASARNVLVFLSLLAMALGAAIAWTIARSITQPLGAAVKVAQTVASGDLSSSIDTRSKDETGQLMRAMKEMNDSLAKIVSQVRGGTEAIASASSQIASGNLDLSSRTEQQASSLEETASSMEELTSTVRQNAENAGQANGLAKSASEIASRGGEVVSQVVDTMAEINDSARKIVDIIGVIDGIAFQTNILALNAAVEAARAGEQGRGFAVVASEVRTLAQRSAAAAKEIKELIGNSVEKVDAGSKLVNQAGDTMNEVVNSVKRVSDIIAEITAASSEQREGIEQVNQAIVQMDQVTQQNAALVEEASAAAEAMQQQSANLAHLVSIFRLDSQATAVSLATQPKVASLPAQQGARPAVAQRPAQRAIARQDAGRLTRTRAVANGDFEEF